jgi:2-methylisocitrate lyase-like PEP mutase family enzyme
MATKPSVRFRELLQRPEILVMPGGCSPTLAKMAEAVGFEAYFIAGSQVSAFLYGVPDVGIIGLRDMVDHARHVAARCTIPIQVDADTGYGNAVNVHFAVQEFVRAGVAAINIEDQEAPKKSGTVAGRRCISKPEALGKIKAAVAAKNAIDPDFVICARCDVMGSEGGTFEEALDRSIAYIEEGGADFIWLNNVVTREQLREACARIPAPVLPLWGGAPPAPNIEELSELGARIALYPTIAASAAFQAAWEILNDLKGRGTMALADMANRYKANPWGPAVLSDYTNADLVRELEEQFIPAELQRDYETTFGHAPVLEGRSAHTTGQG